MGIYTINLGSTLRRTAHKYPDRVALVSPEGGRLTYHQLDRLSNCFANALLNLGVKKGEHIAILSLNSNEQLIAFFGIFKMGGVVVPINVRLAGPEMHWILDHSDSTALIFSKGFKDRVDQLRPELRGVRHYVMIGGEPPGDTLGFEAVLGKGGDDDPEGEVLGDDEAFLYIVDRKKDMIITGGENVYPREVEEVLYTHPKIAEAAVIGVADCKWGRPSRRLWSSSPDRQLRERRSSISAGNGSPGSNAPNPWTLFRPFPRIPQEKS